MELKYLKYSSFMAIAFCLTFANLFLNSSKAAAEITETKQQSLKVSALDTAENQSLDLHLILARSFANETQQIDLQDDFELANLEQTIPLHNQPLIASSFSGKASWYGPGFHGRLTANGERYNQNAMTAAHKHLRFGTRVKVTNLRNGRSVIVRINDRGPFIKGRVIDLSAAAARSLNMIHSGVAPVTITVLGK